MHRNTTRTTAVVGATLALVMAGTAAVAAHPGDRDDRGWERGQAGMGAPMGGLMPGARGLGGMRGALDDWLARVGDRGDRGWQTAAASTRARRPRHNESRIVGRASRGCLKTCVSAHSMCSRIPSPTIGCFANNCRGGVYPLPHVSTGGMYAAPTRSH